MSENLPATTSTAVPATIENQPALLGALIPTQQELAIYQTMAKSAVGSPFFNKLGGEAGVISIMLYARELGIPPMTAITGGLHNIQGRIEISARIINSKIRHAGHIVRVMEHTDQVCRIYGKRRDTGEEMEASFTVAEAEAAGLLKADSNWMKFRLDMLFARAISRLGRWLFPDIIGTAYVEGEARYLDEPIDVTPLPPKRQRKAQTPVPPAATATAKSEEAPAAIEPGGGQEGEQAPEPQDATSAGPPEPAPTIVELLGTIVAYLRDTYHIEQGGLDYMDRLIREEFGVEQPNLVPAEQREELRKFCKGRLMDELGRESWIPLRRA